MKRIALTLFPLLFAQIVFGQGSSYADAQSNYEQKQYTQALAALHNLTEAENADFEAWLLKGDCLQKVEKFAEATEAYREAAKINNESAMLYANWSAALYNQNQMEAAEKKAKKALKLDSDLPEANYFMGNVKYQEFSLSGALRMYNKAIKTRPEYRDALYMRAATHAELKNYKKALQDYNHVLELDPSLEVAKYNIGVIQLATEAYAEAEETFASLNPEKLPKAVDYYYYQAEALYFDGKTEEACPLYKKAADMGDSESEEIYRKYCLEKEKREDKPKTRTIRATF